MIIITKKEFKSSFQDVNVVHEDKGVFSGGGWGEGVVGVVDGAGVVF